MSNAYEETREHYIDIFHSRKAGQEGFPVMEGKIKDIKTGQIKFVKLWKKLSPNAGEYFSGYVFELKKNETVPSEQQ